MVVAQSVPPPKEHLERESKAATSKTNLGAVQRGDLLASKRPDLAHKQDHPPVKNNPGQTSKASVSKQPDENYRLL